MLMVQRAAIGTLSVSFLACLVGCAATSSPADSDAISTSKAAIEEEDAEEQGTEDAPPPDMQGYGAVPPGGPGYGAPPGYGYDAPTHGGAPGAPGFGVGWGGVNPGYGIGYGSNTGYGTGYSSSWSSGAHCDTIYGCVYW